MGIPSVSEAVRLLTGGGVKANVGNPGQVMPKLVTPLVAVNTHESTLAARTLVAHVCGPQKTGREACEEVALHVANIWTLHGADCKWGSYSFDGKCAMHTVKVYGTWTTETEE